MQRHLLPLLLLFFLGCGNDTPEAGAPAGELTAGSAAAGLPPLVEETDEERMAQIAPPPPVCRFLNEADILAILGSEVRIPMPATRSYSMFNSCEYGIDGPGWTATLVIELPDDGNTTQTLMDEVAAATRADAVTLGEDTRARIMNDGRILAAGGSSPFRVKFSAMPRPNEAEPFDAEERRRLLLEFAEVVRGPVGN